MAEIMNWWRDHRPTARRLAQLYAALLYNAHIRGFIEGKIYTGNTKAVCVPGLNCYSCPGAVGACPLGALQNALASSGHVAGWYVFGILLLFGITLGRTVCGWICPLGLIQELLHKIPTPKIRKSLVTRSLTWLKYVILAVFVIALPLYFGLVDNTAFPAFCKFICPAGTGEGAAALLSNPGNAGLLPQLGILFTRKYVIMIIIGLACIFCYRSFCRFICPLGALYSLFNRFALTGVRVDESRCNHCGACVRHCEMDVRCVGDRECISCGKCMGRCAQGAISLKCGKWTLKGPETGKNADPEPVRAARKRKSRIVWGVLLAVLIWALIYFNFIDVPQNAQAGGSPGIVTESETAADAAEVSQALDGTVEITAGDAGDAAVIQEESAETGNDEIPTGYEVGQRLEDFTCELIDGSEFHLADTRGQIVFINQWATYCTPCVGELPHFERLQEENPDIVILAFHHWLETNPRAIPYIEEKGWSDWKLRFAVDTTDMNILNKIGGDNTMPRTVVLNRDGVVIYNEPRSVTYEMLLSLLEKAETP